MKLYLLLDRLPEVQSASPEERRQRSHAACRRVLRKPLNLLGFGGMVAWCCLDTIVVKLIFLRYITNLGDNELGTSAIVSICLLTGLAGASATGIPAFVYTQFVMWQVRRELGTEGPQRGHVQ